MDGAVRHAAAAVSGEQLDVVDALPGEIPPRLPNQIRPQLDAHDIGGQASEQRGLEAQAGTDLEHVFVPGEIKTFDHPC